MRKLYDISRTVATTTAVWPGDTPYSLQHVLRLSEGASVNLTTLTMSAHTGTHCDAPYHYVDGEAHPADVGLEPYIGPAHVVTVKREHGGITPADLPNPNLAKVERLLIHTWVSELPDDKFPEDFPYPTIELIDWLAERGGVLFGVDMHSVDRFNSKDLECHHRLYKHGMLNLETLKLAGVPDGEYELIALPLKLAGACGSPLRAVLRELP